MSPTNRGAVAATPASTYFPERFDWQHKKAEEVGMDPARIAEAIKVSVDRENPASKDLNIALATSFGRGEPFDTPIGPVKPRGPASGVITRHGYIVAEWGEPNRVDMTFSVTKTFLTTVIGLAWQRGLIRDAKRRTTRRSNGTTCCGRRATGRARCGANRTGRIVPKDSQTNG
ncbi:MAG: hypothetical protein AUJ01_06505 [Acidobacteria bacterium 13_1_40CM_3_65_5]|nr:MAG: hypothetical protein AUJ01_06505 [Acidobacteria bacterium 13_1_40CM_3_65_5]